MKRAPGLERKGRARAYWLMKSEAAAYSIADLERDAVTSWDGVRNYEARNAMDAMRVGDLALFYHSNSDPSGAAGVMEVAAASHPDPTAWDRKDSHFDPRSTPQNPLWRMVDVRFIRRFPRIVSLADLKADPHLDGMLLRAGTAMRLSIQPLGKRHFDRIVALRQTAAPEAVRSTRKVA